MFGRFPAVYPLLSFSMLVVGCAAAAPDDDALADGKEDRAGVRNLLDPDGSDPNPGWYAFPLTPKEEARVHTVLGWGVIKLNDFYYYCIQDGKEQRWFHSSRLVGFERVGTCSVDGADKALYEIKYRM
jgi:hypothetical protein